MLKDPSNPRSNLTPDEAEDLLTKITETSQEAYRAKILEQVSI